MSLKCVNGSLGFLLNRGTLTLQRQLNRNFSSNGYDITHEQWSVLIYLYHFDGQSQNDIAAKTQRDKVSITKIIDNLEKRGLVFRTTDNVDRRIKRICLTKDGKSLVPKLKNLAEETIKSAFSGIKKKEIETFKFVLSSLVKNLTGDDLLEFITINKGRWK